MSSREEMTRKIREGYGLKSPQVLSAMLQIPREKFVLEKDQFLAYEDRPLEIGSGQTISQPYTVAFMTHLLFSHFAKATRDKIKVLEIGTGSGYQAAVLAKLFAEVYTVEIIPQLAKKAKKILLTLGFENIHFKTGSGEEGWKEQAPYDAIMVTAGVEKVPQALFEQLRIGGVLVAPVGEGEKNMVRFVKTSTKGGSCSAGKNFKLRTKNFGVFSFVPFI